MNIQLANISKSFIVADGNIEIFRNLDLKIKSGDFVSILGPNGCGKTTLFNIIMGLDNNYSGSISIDHNRNHRTELGYMLQKDLLLPWRTVYENIIIGLQIKNKVSKQTINYVKEYLEKFGILNLINSYPARLSGGERQKVALVRTLILGSDILLLDEPFSSIDYNTRIELQTKIYSLTKEQKKTTILITHDIDEAIAVSDRVIIFNQKPLGVLKDFQVELNVEHRSPLTARQHPKFADYYFEIWKSLPKQSTS